MWLSPHSVVVVCPKIPGTAGMVACEGYGDRNRAVDNMKSCRTGSPGKSCRRESTHERRGFRLNKSGKLTLRVNPTFALYQDEWRSANAYDSSVDLTGIRASFRERFEKVSRVCPKSRSR